jgi:hypothetical protein
MQGVPARYLPTEMKTGDRSNRRTIDLSLLRQTPPLDPVTGGLVHRIDAGDVLGVYVEGFVGKATEPAPVYFPQNNDSPPSFGHPYPVREDGTISLPFVGSVNLRGMTLAQAEERVRQSYLNPRQLIRPDLHRVQVNLQRPRQYRVLVIRQDSRAEPQSNAFLGQLNIGMVKRGTGKVVNLPVYSNDVLNALTATEGLPGLDAENAVYVIRRRGNGQGGTLDPRWPADLNPALLNQPFPMDVPAIRGQSPDEPRGPLHQPHVTQAYFQGSPNQFVQQVNMGAVADPYRGTASVDPMVAPPEIWPDRNAMEEMFRPAAAQIPTGPMNVDPRWRTGPTPLQPNGPPLSPMTSNVPQQPMYPAGPNGATGDDAPYSAGPNGGYAGPVNSMYPTPSGPGLPMGPGPMMDPGHAIDGGGVLDGRHVIRIPIRLGPGETADIRPEDVVLYDGDIVFIESRDTEVFYTGGLLGGGQYTLPRDYDLDILQAISLATSRGNTGVSRAVGGVSALNNDVSISPSTAIILRKLPDGGEVPVKVDLYRARSDLSERVVVQPGDYILLQYTPLEAVAAFFERHLLETALFSLAAQSFNRTGN